MQAPRPTADERLDALERENAALRKALKLRQLWGAGCLSILALLGFSFISSQNEIVRRLGGDVYRLQTSLTAIRTTPLPSLIEAQGFVVKDHAGKVRATLGRTGHPTDDRHAETGLQLWTDGKQRGSLVVDGHGWGVLSLSDAGENNRLTVAGEGMDAGLVVADENGDGRLSLGVSEDGSPNLSFHAKGDRPRVQFGVHRDGDELPYFDLFDKSGSVRSFISKDGLPVTESGTR